ncbi:Do family serine endopeptidase [Rubellicoccus peritrichatus]|uniref:Do family serine endopeptidase n=1 Tax=Rubellicoccus peritrichatus TaxID=3080537 RepID=A0AAQ3L800_9BACT|nr:Do family serine endopeptidase [Puniceicoccus sp. CR14]WOO40746.1 Do family serine endopeptidase [Puniceicoccus sp. CR14]
MHRKTYPFFVVAALAVASVLFTSDYAGKLCAAEEEDEFPPVELKRDTSDLNRKDSARIVSYADVLEPITPAVVSVYTAQVRETDPRREALEEMMRRYFGMPQQQTPDTPQNDEPEPTGMGSGFIVSKDGYILTNNHVVKGLNNTTPDEITVKLRDGREFDAKLVGGDSQTDVAVLKIDADDLPFLTIGDSSQLRVGDIVFAVGNPLGIGLTVTQGIISAMDRTDLGILQGGFESFIQTDAAINRGNSGGPLVDAEGRVIGINSAIISDSYFGGNIGIGFAIPVDLAANVMESLVEGGEVRRGFIGIRPEPLTRELAEAFGLNNTKGAVVARVTPDLPADKAGLRHGDVVLTVNGDQVDSVNDLIYLISKLEPGTIAKLGISRGGKDETIDVKLGDRSQLIAGAVDDAYSTPQQDLFEGVKLKPVSDKVRNDFDIPEDVSGLLIEEVTQSSPYGRTLAPGVVIIEINGKPVATIDEAKAALKEDGKVNSVYVYFEGNFTYTTITVKKE